MTKTKKMICIALALLMIAGAVFFAIYNKVGKKYDYAKIKDYSKYITIGNLDGLSFAADDSKISEPTSNDVQAKVGSALRGLLGDDDKKKKEGTIGTYDAVYVNYYGTYEDADGNVVYFLKGDFMDKANPTVFYVNSGTDSKLFGGETYKGQPAIGTLNGMSPDPDGYVLKATGAEDDETVIDGDDVVYITYTWVRYPYVIDEDGNRVQEDGKDKVGEGENNTTVEEDEKRVTDEFRLDLANVPAYFPADFAEKLIGKTVSSTSYLLTFEDVNVGDVDYRYDYTVTVKRVVDPTVLSGFVALSYTYAPDATDKDVYGKELKGKTVTFYVSIASFDDAPDLTKDVVMNDIKFAETDYYKNKVQEYDDWKEENENQGKTEADYDRYLVKQYVASIEKSLKDQYDSKRMQAAAKPMWEAIKEQVNVVKFPKKALKLAKSDLLSEFKAVFNNGTFTNAEGKTVSYRTQYGSFKKFMNACYKSSSIAEQLGLDTNAAYQKAVEDGKSYGECIDAAAEEIVTNKLIIYALSDRYGSKVRVRGSVFNSQKNMMYLYYSYGLTNVLLPDSALREGIMFDNVMQYIYNRANVQWASAAE